ncbi:heparinase II/III-family protein [Echinicola sediminis]
MITLLLQVVFVGLGQAQEKRDLLAKELSLKADEAWKMSPDQVFPNRTKIKESLSQLPTAVIEEMKADAEKARAYDWPSIPVSAYLDFVRNGDRTRMQSYQSKRISTLKSLVLAELLEQRGEYIDAIADGVWAVCEQSTWVLSAHLNAQKAGAGVPDITEPVIDLGAGEVANLLAWIHFYFKVDFETISPLLANRIEKELDERIISPYLERDDFWWMGFKSSFVNNWNPWCNYNVLLTASLVEKDPQRLGKVLEKSARSVDQFINYYKTDGACEEGPAYWDHAAGKMMEYLELSRQLTEGKVYIGDQAQVQNMGNYIRKAHIVDDYYVNFADASARLKAHPGIIFRYGNYIKDDQLRAFAAKVSEQTGFKDSPLSGSLDRALNNVLLYEDLLGFEVNTTKEKFFWYPQTEVVGGRSEEGLFFAAKGGHNNESHNHNDVGSFILYYQDKPLLIDIGVETYSAKTFSKDRYDIWTMQSDFHNLPKINGVSQKNGNDFKSKKVDFAVTARNLDFKIDISEAYPEQAMCKFWERSYQLDRKREKLEIKDKFSLKAWKQRQQLHFMCLDIPQEISKGVVKLAEKGEKTVLLKFPSDKLSFSVEQWDMTDSRLQKVWGESELYRMVFVQKGEDAADEWEIEVIVK